MVASGARLKLRLMVENWSSWLTSVGATVSTILVTAVIGTIAPELART